MRVGLEDADFFRPARPLYATSRFVHGVVTWLVTKEANNNLLPVLHLSNVSFFLFPFFFPSFFFLSLNREHLASSIAKTFTAILCPSFRSFRNLETCASRKLIKFRSRKSMGISLTHARNRNSFDEFLIRFYEYFYKLYSFKVILEK